MKENNEGTKRRLLTAVAIMAGLLLFFLAAKALAGVFDRQYVVIDSTTYSVSDRSVELTLMYEDGVEHIRDFTRLEELKITPFREAMRGTVKDDAPPEAKAQIEAMIKEQYADCTDVEDISYIEGLDINKLDISRCAVSDCNVIATLKGLRELDISYTEITDISPLAELGELSVLHIEGLDIEDTSPLFDMPALTVVYGADEQTAEELAKAGITAIN